jgi:hypothetical protein
MHPHRRDKGENRMGTRQVNRKRIRGTRHGLRRQRLALALAAAFSLPAAPVAAQSLPESGTVTQGTATINTAGNTMTIQQATHGAIIDWGSFNIAAGNTVNFVQPDASSVTLNRVIGFGSPSLIDGSRRVRQWRAGECRWAGRLDPGHRRRRLHRRPGQPFLPFRKRRAAGRRGRKQRDDQRRRRRLPGAVSEEQRPDPRRYG